MLLEEKKNELEACSFCKTILMILIVFYHSIVFWTGDWFSLPPVYASNSLAVVATWLNSFHIYTFTLISGYIFFAQKYELGKYPDISQFIFKKVKRLVVPFLFISALWAVPFSILFFGTNWTDIIQKFVFGISPAQLWFCLMLFGVFMIFYVLSDFFFQHDFYGAFLVLVFYGIGSLGLWLKPIPNIYQIYMIFRYMPHFWLGYKIRQHGSQILQKCPLIIWLVLDILLFCLCQYVQTYSGMIFKFLEVGISFLLNVIGAITAFLVTQNIAAKVSYKNSKTLSVFRKYSMPVYLLHQQIIYCFIFCFNGLLNPYVHVLVNFVGAMMISLFLSSILMKCRWTRFMLGEA